MRSAPEPPGDVSSGGSGIRTNRDEIGRFGDPITRMLLAGDGFTMPVLEAILGTELQVRVLRQDDIAAGRLPETVTGALRLTDADRVIVRRSCLVNADLVTVSVNHVVTVSGPAAASGVDDVHIPIGHSLMARGLAQRRQILRTGLTRWPDGRLCAAKAYVIVLGDRPLCYIRESFNPAVIPPDHAQTVAGDLHWADEPDGPEFESADLSAVPRATYDTAEEQPGPRPPGVEHTGVARLRALPPLVHPYECDALTTELAEAARGDALVLHLGDSAEALAVFDARALAARRALLHAAAAVLRHGLGTRVVAVGGLTGQYAEPAPPTARPGPDRLLENYFHAAAALNDVRGAPLPTALGTQILRRAADQCRDPTARALLREVAGLLPMAAVAPAASRELYSSISRPHVSQEALVLPYEFALTRRGPRGQWWDCSTQLLCIGDDARDPAGEHVAFAARVRNPVAVALGPTATAHDVRALCRVLNPDNREGRLTLIPRLGAAGADAALPVLFDAAAGCGTPVCWVCDPVHANTHTQDGHRLHLVDDVVAEIRAFLRACRAAGVVPAGLHLDWTPEADTLHCVVAALAEWRAA